MEPLLAAPWSSVFTTLPTFVCAPEESSSKKPAPAHRRPRQANLRRESPAVPASELIGGVLASELIARLREGDVTAFDTLYRSLFPVLWSIAVLQTHSGDTAEEIVQDVFLRLWVGRTTLHISGDVRVYLSASVRNAAQNLRKHGNVVTMLEDVVTQAARPIPAMGEPTTPTDVAVERDEFVRAYRRALSALTEEERTAAFLRWEEEWPFERIGAVLSMSKVGAFKVVARAQKKLQKILAELRG